MQPVLQVRLLGDFDVRVGSTPLGSLDSGRAASLLAYLALHRDAPQPRQALAFRLWPDSTEAQALTNLRHVLHTLRRALPEAERFLDARARTLQWRTEAECWIDVAAFDAALALADTAQGDSAVAALREAVALYRGELLAGSYDEWLQDERDRLRRRYLATLERLVAALEARGDHADALGYAERLLREDPLREDTYRALMRLHDARGDRAKALHAYHACAATLDRELGVQPSSATRAVYEALLRPETDQPPAVEAPTHAATWPLVGRAAEWTRLTSVWRAAESGHAHLVLVTGEAGVGKTRLVDELRAWCAHRGAHTAMARSYAAEGALAYAPLVEWLRSETFAPSVTRLDRARQAMLARLLPELRARTPDLPETELLPDASVRHQLFDAAAEAILAANAPVLLVADDLQWCDRETLQFLHYLLRTRPTARLLVAATVRREELDPHDAVHELVTALRTVGRCSEIALDRLTPEESAILAERVGGSPVLTDGGARLHDETGGNPLFVIEAVRAGWTPATGGAWTTPRVQAVIESRLAQLSPTARDLLGVAAAVGREFTAQVLAAASDCDDAGLVRALDELWRRGIVHERGADSYDFSHDKIREVTYEALSPVARRQHHLRLATELERLHADDPGTVAAQVAAHYDRAGVAETAVAWYERAALMSQQLGANNEAIRLLERALALLASRPDSAERREKELAILTALPAVIGSAEGYAAPRLDAVHVRALDLARATGVTPGAPLLRSLAVVSLTRSDFEDARRYAGQLEALARRAGDDASRVECEYILGIAAFWQGKLEEAREHFETAVALYHPTLARHHVAAYGLDPKVVCQSRLANTLWILGETDRAVAARASALALAQELAHGHTHVVGLVFAGMLALDMRDRDGLRDHTAALERATSADTGPHTHVVAHALRGYLDILDGHASAGLARVTHVLDSADLRDPAPGTRAILARVLLEACVASGDARSGLAAADRALAMEGGIGPWEAEARRLRAEFLATLGATRAEVEAEIARARDVARRQGAKSFEERIEATATR